MIIVTIASLFDRKSKRRRILNSLKDKSKRISEIANENPEIKGGVQYISGLMPGMIKKGFVKKIATDGQPYYGITKKGKDFIKIEDIEEAILWKKARAR